MDPKWRHFFWKLSLLSPLVWGAILLLVALILIRVDGDFFKKLAILPTIVALFLFYQAFFKGKIY
jgi:hypothetical protein